MVNYPHGRETRPARGFTELLLSRRRSRRLRAHLHAAVASGTEYPPQEFTRT